MDICRLNARDARFVPLARQGRLAPRKASTKRALTAAQPATGRAEETSRSGAGASRASPSQPSMSWRSSGGESSLARGAHRHFGEKTYGRRASATAAGRSRMSGEDRAVSGELAFSSVTACFVWSNMVVTRGRGKLTVDRVDRPPSIRAGPLDPGRSAARASRKPQRPRRRSRNEVARRHRPTSAMYPSARGFDTYSV